MDIGGTIQVCMSRAFNKERDFEEKKTDGGAIDNEQINKLKSSVLFWCTPAF